MIMIFGIILLGTIYGIIGLAVTHLIAASSQAMFLIFSHKMSKTSDKWGLSLDKMRKNEFYE